MRKQKQRRRKRKGLKVEGWKKRWNNEGKEEGMERSGTESERLPGVNSTFLLVRSRTNDRKTTTTTPQNLKP